MGHRSRAEWWWVMMWCAVLAALAVLIWPGKKSGRLRQLAGKERTVDSAAINLSLIHISEPTRPY